VKKRGGGMVVAFTGRTSIIGLKSAGGSNNRKSKRQVQCKKREKSGESENRRRKYAGKKTHLQ